MLAPTVQYMHVPWVCSHRGVEYECSFLWRVESLAGMREVTVVGVREWPARAVNKNVTHSLTFEASMEAKQVPH